MGVINNFSLTTRYAVQKQRNSGGKGDESLEKSLMPLIV